MILHWKPKRRQCHGYNLVEVLISFFILTVVMAGVIDGYVQINRMATWSSWSLAAQSVASEGLEQARGAQWNELGGMDQWPPTTNSSGAVAPWMSTNCTLDVPSTGAPIYVTNLITISTVSVTPPIRMIRSDCVWTYPITGTVATNTLITLRAPDQ